MCAVHFIQDPFASGEGRNLAAQQRAEFLGGRCLVFEKEQESFRFAAAAAISSKDFFSHNALDIASVSCHGYQIYPQ